METFTNQPTNTCSEPQDSASGNRSNKSAAAPAVNGWHRPESTTAASSSQKGDESDKDSAPVTSEATIAEFEIKPSQPFGTLLAKWKEPAQVVILTEETVEKSNRKE